MPPESAAPEAPAARAYWRANLRLIAALLSVWFLASYGCGILWADWLNQFRIGGIKLGFFFAQQGAIYVFLMLIAIYAWQMGRLERRYGRGGA